MDNIHTLLSEHPLDAAGVVKKRSSGWWFGNFVIFHFILMGCHPSH
jgi:hypothetical protein